MWSAYYFTNKKSYYPIPRDIPLLPPIPAVSMSNVHQDYMREWARNNGKTVQQRTVRQETTKYRSGTLPLNMYQTEEQMGEKLQMGQVLIGKKQFKVTNIVMKVVVTLAVI